jgi:hypothetical protein
MDALLFHIILNSQYMSKEQCTSGWLGLIRTSGNFSMRLVEWGSIAILTDFVLAAGQLYIPKIPS